MASTPCICSLAGIVFTPPFFTFIDLNLPDSSKMVFPANCEVKPLVVISAPSPGVSPLWSKVTPFTVLRSAFKAILPQTGPHKPAPLNGKM